MLDHAWRDETLVGSRNDFVVRRRYDFEQRPVYDGHYADNYCADQHYDRGTGTNDHVNSPSDYCQVSDLHGSVEGTEGAAGTIEVTFRLTNVSPSECVFWGYPGALMLGPGGTPSTDVVRGGSLSFLDIAVETVTVPAGESAYFNLGYSDVVTGGESSCPTSSSLEITPPNDTEQLVVQVKIDACDGGRLSVSPVFGAPNPATSTTAPPD